jgi:hypothetical protein
MHDRRGGLVVESFVTTDERLWAARQRRELQPRGYGTVCGIDAPTLRTVARLFATSRR